MKTASATQRSHSGPSMMDWAIDAAHHHRNGGDSGIGQDIREGQALGLSPGGRDVHPSYQYR